MSIAKKLTLSSVSMLLMILAISMASFIGASRLGGALDRAVNRTSRKAELVGGIRAGFEDMKAGATSTQVSFVIALLTEGAGRSAKQAVEGTACTDCHGSDFVTERRDHMLATAREVRQQLGELKPLLVNSKEKDAVEILDRRASDWMKLYQQYLVLAGSKQFGKAHPILTEQMLPMIAEIDKATKSLTDVQHQEMTSAADEARRTRSNTDWIAGLLTCVGLGLGGWVLFLIPRIIRSLRVVTKAADQLATGDTNVDDSLTSLAARNRDELGRLATSFQSMAENIRQQALAAERIAAGDLSVEVSIRSEQDVLAKSMAGVVEALRKLISETRRLTEGAVAGQLSTRGDVSLFQGGYREVVAGMNNTLDSVIGPLNVAADNLRRISQGALPPKITAAYQGDFNAIKESLNACIEHISAVIAAMKRMSEQHDSGDIDAVIDEARFQGAYREMAAGVNSMVGGHLGMSRKVMACVAEFGRGSFDAPLVRFPGKKAYVNDIVEDVRGNLQGFNREIKSLVAAAVEGRLSTRANVGEFSGGWRDLVEGTNQLLDAVLTPIGDAASVIERIASRDLTARLGGQYQGEHATLAKNINQMAGRLRESIRSVAESATSLASAAEEFTAVSQQMASNAEETVAQASVVLQASSEVTRNVSIAADDSAGMQAQIQEISKSAAESTKVARRAVDVAQTANQMLERLESSSVAIGNVVKVISAIAAQTNLLALNASIEAARAGEAGRGFSIVANEVKELAKETAAATSGVRHKIEAIQRDTREATGAIGEVTAIIRNIAEIAHQIANSVESQTLATNRIGQNVEHAAKSTSQIAQNISGVAEAAKDTSRGSAQSQSAAQALTRMAVELQDLVRTFQV